MVIDIYFFSNKETNSYIAAPLHNLLNYPGVGSSFSIIAVWTLPFYMPDSCQFNLYILHLALCKYFFSAIGSLPIQYQSF